MTTMTKADLAAQLAAAGVTLTPSQIKKSAHADLVARLAARGSGPKPKARRSRGITCAARVPFKPFRDGTKQAALYDLAARPDGATMDELQAVVPNWKVSSITSAFGYDLARLHGVDVWTTFDNDTARYHAKPGSVKEEV